MVHQLKWLLIFLVLLTSCTRLGGLGMQRHRFGDLPTKIIWIQVAGLTDEHLAMLHFFMPTTYEKTSFSKSRCLGKVWTYNLYKLRPNSATSFLSQLTGKKNFHESCDDFQSPPIWSYFKNLKVAKGVLENTRNENNSLLKANKCEEKKESPFLRDLVFWEMSKAPKDNKLFFHHQEKDNFHPNLVYYDRNCQQQEDCSNSFFSNAEFVFQSHFKNLNDYFYLIRDFEFEKKLKSKDIGGARKILVEIEKIFFMFAKMAEEQKQVLLLLSTAAPLEFEFPVQGESWKTFEKNGTPVIFHTTSLLGTVFAVGSRAENFCGLYEESEILQRILRPFSSLELEYL